MNRRSVLLDFYIKMTTELSYNKYDPFILHVGQSDDALIQLQP